MDGRGGMGEAKRWAVQFIILDGCTGFVNEAVLGILRGWEVIGRTWTRRLFTPYNLVPLGIRRHPSFPSSFPPSFSPSRFLPVLTSSHREYFSSWEFNHQEKRDLFLCFFFFVVFPFLSLLPSSFFLFIFFFRPFWTTTTFVTEQHSVVPMLSSVLSPNEMQRHACTIPLWIPLFFFSLFTSRTGLSEGLKEKIRDISSLLRPLGINSFTEITFS